MFLAGCEFSCTIGSSISAGELEKQVGNSYEKETGIAIDSITCEEADPDPGSSISCRATNEGGVDLKIAGTVTSYDSVEERVDFDWKVVRAVAPGNLYGDAAARTLTRTTGVEVSEVRCPEEIVVRKGARVDCTAISADGTQSRVTLTLTDRDGGFRVRSSGSGVSTA